ncbi:RNase A-like domain-containing protein [Streptomyces griseosporeus]|uniref:RNase A-like domain-containing protein n=1 Tax=Streptomyces griseosporeus TaxID=1910 RepID=UPI0036C03C3A
MATPAPSPSASPSSGPVPAPTTSPSPPANGSSSSPSNAPTPQPSPGSLTDPNGKDISRSDWNSERKQRADELAGMKPAPPGNAVGFDVQPQHVYYASYMLRNAHYDFLDRATSLVNTLASYPHAVGCGSGPEAFAKTYAEVSDLFLRVWCRAAEGVGGAAVGLTVTANNYAQADQATHPQVPVVARKNPPDVLKNPSAGGPVAELGWGNAQGADSWGDKIIDEIVGALGWVGDHVLRPVLRDALRHGKVADITPGGDDMALPKIAACWRVAGADAKKSAETFDDALSYITNPAVGRDEWQSAMKQFCSALWGTTAWGKEQHGYQWGHKQGQQPALDVLQDTARGLAAACDDVCAEVKRVRSTITDVYKDAAVRTFSVKNAGDLLDLLTDLNDLALEFIANIDTGRLNSAVDSYNREIHRIADGLGKMKAALLEAERSVPRYAAEEARAEAFGARALNDFKKEHHFAVPGLDPDNMYFPLDLASQEGLYDSHAIDKHVGLTDDQLRMRLRDQSSAPAASTFKDLASAQKVTTAAIDDIDNADRIDKWIQSVEKKIKNNPNYDPNKSEIQPPIYKEFPGQTVGRSVSRSDYDRDSMRAKAEEKDWVQVRLIYKKGLEPPFIVLTAMPHGAP